MLRPMPFLWFFKTDEGLFYKDFLTVNDVEAFVEFVDSGGIVGVENFDALEVVDDSAVGVFGNGHFDGVSFAGAVKFEVFEVEGTDVIAEVDNDAVGGIIFSRGILTFEDYLSPFGSGCNGECVKIAIINGFITCLLLIPSTDSNGRGIAHNVENEIIHSLGSVGIVYSNLIVIAVCSFFIVDIFDAGSSVEIKVAGEMIVPSDNFITVGVFAGKDN